MAVGITNCLVGGGSSGNTLKNLLDATQNASGLFSNYQGTSVDNLIAYDDTSNVVTTSNMFKDCQNLIAIPTLNTSNVTNMVAMFKECRLISTIPLLDTSNVTSMYEIFYGCKKLETIPLLDTSNVTSMGSMFQGCNYFKTMPLLNTSNVTNTSYMFGNCYPLTTIPALDVSKVTYASNMFYACSNLKSILMTGMKVSFNISASTKFERADLLIILNNLATVTTTQTLTMGATNLAKLTDEEKAIATNKGWTLA